DLQRLPVVSLPFAHFTGDVNIRQEMHLDLDNPVTAAGLAAAALHVEAEPSLLVSPHLGLGGGREDLPNIVEDAGVGGRVGPGGAADGGLIDVDHLVQIVDPHDLVMGAGAPICRVRTAGLCLADPYVTHGYS